MPDEVVAMARDVVMAAGRQPKTEEGLVSDVDALRYIDAHGSLVDAPCRDGEVRGIFERLWRRGPVANREQRRSRR